MIALYRSVIMRVRVKFNSDVLRNLQVTISAKIFKIVVYILEMQRLLMWHEIVYSWVFLMIRFIYRSDLTLVS